MEEAGDLEAIVLRILGDAPARRRKRHELEERSGEITKRLAALSRRWAAHKRGDVLRLVCRSRSGPRVVYLNALTPVLVLRSRSGPVCVYLPGEHELLPDINRLREELRVAQKRLDQARSDDARLQTRLRHEGRRWAARMRLEDAKEEFARRRTGAEAPGGRKLPPPAHALANDARFLFDLGLPDETISQ